MKRLALLLAAAAPAAQAAEGYHFTVGVPVPLAYEMRQDVDWSSGGDRLTYATEQAWQFFLMPVTVTAERVDLHLTVTRIIARHQGPGGVRVFDSSGTDTPEGPLGHLAALVGAPINLAIEPTSGRVLAASGSERLVERMDRLVPSKEPGEPAPLHAAAEGAFSNTAISRLAESWLRLPAAGSATEAYPLIAPLSGTAVRVWSGRAYTVTLPVSATAVPVTMGEGATAVTGWLTDLSGRGLMAPEKVPARAEGAWTFTLRLITLTQPATATHRLTWRLLPAVVKP